MLRLTGNIIEDLDDVQNVYSNADYPDIRCYNNKCF